MNEARYNRLTREFPDRAENLFERNEENAKARYENLQRLNEMYKKSAKFQMHSAARHCAFS